MYNHCDNVLVVFIIQGLANIFIYLYTFRLLWSYNLNVFYMDVDMDIDSRNYAQSCDKRGKKRRI